MPIVYIGEVLRIPCLRDASTEGAAVTAVAT